MLGVAFFKGNNQDGWENKGPNRWEHSENENYPIYHQPYTDHNEQGEILKDFDVVFGEIDNKDIKRIKVATKGNNDFKEVKMMDHGNKR